MSGQKRRRGKEPVGVSAPAPPSSRFVSPSVEDIYKKWFANRAVLIERAVSLAAFAESGVDKFFVNKDWSGFFTISGDVNKTIVREFYAAFTERVHLTHGYRVTIRGVEFSFTTSKIADFLGIRCIPFAQYPCPLNTEVLSLTTMATHLCGKDTFWSGSTLSYKSLTLEHKILHLIVANCLYLTKHSGHLTSESAHLLYCLSTGASFCLSTYIMNMIIGLAAHKKSKRGLMFGLLITKMCLAEGVEGIPTDDMGQQMSVMTQSVIKRSLGQLKNYPGEEEGGAGVAEEEEDPDFQDIDDFTFDQPSAEVDPDQILDLIGRVEDKLDHLDEKVVMIDGRLVRIEDLIKDMASNVSAMHLKMFGDPSSP